MKEYIKTTLRNKIGIYKILNTQNNKFYIGSSINLYHRLHQHLSKLRSNSHTNSKLQNSWNKYKEENFIIEIMEECDKDIVREKEINYINLLKPEFNLINDFNEYYFSKETRERMSLSAKNLNKVGKNHFASKVIECYDLDGNYIRNYESVNLAIKSMNINTKNNGACISKCIYNQRISAYGYQWKLKEDNKVIKPLNNKAKLNALDCKKKIILVDKDHNQLNFTNNKILLEYLNQQMIKLKEGEECEFKINIRLQDNITAPL